MQLGVFPTHSIAFIDHSAIDKIERGSKRSVLVPLLNGDPEGPTGELLWVRESVRFSSPADLRGVYILWDEDRPRPAVARPIPNEVVAESLGEEGVMLNRRPGYTTPWYSASDMPYWSARLWLRITGIAVLPLQDILSGPRFLGSLDTTPTELERVWEEIRRLGGVRGQFQLQTLGALETNPRVQLIHFETLNWLERLLYFRQHWYDQPQDLGPDLRHSP